MKRVIKPAKQAWTKIMNDDLTLTQSILIFMLLLSIGGIMLLLSI